MGATPIWRMSISQQNKDVNDIINEWTEKGNRDASDKACKAIREYYKRNQLIQLGVPINQNEAFIQQAEFENNFATPLDNIPVSKLHEEELTEVQLNPLNEEQAVQLVNKIREIKDNDKILRNETFVTDFFNVVDVYDERLRKKIPTIQNTEYERRRKEQEREAFEKKRQEEEIKLAAKEAERERLFAIEKELDSNKSFEQLAEETIRLVQNAGYSNNMNRSEDITKAAIKLKMSESEIDDLSSELAYKIKEKAIERLKTNGYATPQQIDEYDRNKRAEAAEQARIDREYAIREAEFKRQREEQRQKDEAELKKQREEKERQEFEEDVNRLVGGLLNPKEDAEGFLLWYETDYEVTAEEFHRIRAIPDPEQQKIEARKYIEPRIKAFKELHEQPEDIYHKVMDPREDKQMIRMLTRELLNPEVDTEKVISQSDNWLQLTPEEVYAIKKLTNDPELQKVKAKFYAEQQIKERRKRIIQQRKEEEKEAAKAATIKSRGLLKHS